MACLAAAALSACTGGHPQRLAQSTSHAGAKTAPNQAVDPGCTSSAPAWRRAVCADPDLRSADAAVARSYATALAAAPEPWRDAVRASQASWLSYMSVACMPGDLEAYEPTETLAACRAGELASRKTALDRTVTTLDDRRFVRLVTYHAAPAPADDLEPGEPPRSRRTQAVLLQIADPATAAERGWNAAVASRLTSLMQDQPDTSALGVVAIEAIGPDFIQAVVRRSDDVGGGGTDLKFSPLSWSLRLGRAVTAQDLFRDPAAGAAAVARLAEAHLQRETTEVDRDFLLTTSELRDLLAPTRYWSFNAKGLTFDVDNDGEYGPVGDAGSEVKTTIPWSELQPYLRSTLPFDPKRLKTTA